MLSVASLDSHCRAAWAENECPEFGVDAQGLIAWAWRPAKELWMWLLQHFSAPKTGLCGLRRLNRTSTGPQRILCGDSVTVSVAHGATREGFLAFFQLSAAL